MEQEVQNVYDDKESGDTDQEDGDLLNFPILPITKVSTSICEQVEENINVNIAKEKEEVYMEDVEMDEDHDVDISKTKDALEWSLVLTSNPNGKMGFQPERLARFVW
ncbi:hypothetical protein Tco_0597315 [Tanacetum coccineum]